MPRQSNNQLTSDQLTSADFTNLIDKYISGEIGEQDFRRIVSKMDLGESYDNAQKGWSRFFQRTGHRVVGLPQEWAEAAQGGFGIAHLNSLIDQYGPGMGTAAWVGEIAHGSTVGMALLAKELLLGHGDLADAIELTATFMPVTRVAGAVKVANAVKKSKQQTQQCVQKY